ncbi:MAG: exonuclease domain-containing protein, partial [Coriobacteriia bacterium]|nr:exonuclease domain-containing protein [Coriobacteriia bacterium]
PEVGFNAQPNTGDEYALRYAKYSEKARKELFGIEEEICVLDVETTGISPVYESIIEIAIARMRGPEIIDEYNVYVNPGKPIPREITELTGISDKDVADAPQIGDIASDIRDFIGDCDILAHNASFDRSFVEAALGDADCDALSGQWLDSLVFLRCGLPLLRSFKLEDLMRAYCPEEYAQAHRAIADVRGLCHLWRVALVGLSSLDSTVLRALPDLLKDSPERDWIAQVAELYAGTAAGKASSSSSRIGLKALRQQKIKGLTPDDLLDARAKEGITSVAAGTIQQDLSEGGLAGKMYAAFESRPEQADMAAAIRDSFEQRNHLVVEAGTGVGKSLAYLVCLARLAVENSITVGVATKTNALTDQLIGKELPLLAQALAEEDVQLRYAALKGYSHYPCLRKISNFLSDDSKQNRLATAQMLAWVSQTAWGELSNANLPLPYREKQHYAANSADCLRRRCSHYYQCYVHGARRTAKGAHIVITNHSLLFRNSGTEGKILPPIRYWAIDEAHSLESEARKQLSRSFDERDLDAAVKLISGSRGLPRRLLSGAGKYMDKGGVEKVATEVDELQKQLQQLQVLSGNFFAFAHDLDNHESLQSNPAYATSTAARTHWIGPELRESAAWGTLCSVGMNLVAQLQTCLEAGKSLTSAYSVQLMEDTPPTELSDFAGVMAMLSAYTDTLVTAINEPEENLVYALSLSREYQGKRTAAIEISQLEVGEKIATEFLEQTDSAIFTSATLAVGTSFNRFVSGVGLDMLEPGTEGVGTVGADTSIPHAGSSSLEAGTHDSAAGFSAAKWHTLQLASSYDLVNLMRIFVPADIPEPRESAWTKQFRGFLKEVHLRSQGGVLTLFTSRRDLLNCRDVLQDELQPKGIPVLAQDGMLTMRVLQERFIADPQASLLATKSFWEGFDASGDTLRCIVIPKLPFGRPDTPLSRERNQVYGRGAWARFDLPEAILELKQAVGRLVRTSTDSGIVILADTRVLSKGYGKRVLGALPVPAEIHTMDEILNQINNS